MVVSCCSSIRCRVTRGTICADKKKKQKQKQKKEKKEKKEKKNGITSILWNRIEKKNKKKGKAALNIHRHTYILLLLFTF